MLNTNIKEIILEVPLKMFNYGPLQAIYSLMSSDCNILGYVVSNVLTHEQMLLVKVFYTSASLDQLYYVTKDELLKHMVDDNLYIIDNITIKGNFGDYVIVPLKLMPTREGYINIRLNPISRCLDSFNTLTTQDRFNKTYPAIISIDPIEDYNKTFSDMPNITLNGDTITVNKNDKKHTVKLNANLMNGTTAVEECIKYKRNKACFCGALDIVSSFIFISSPKDIKPNSSVTTGYCFYMNDTFKEYFKNLREGLLVCFKDRSNPLLCIYVPVDHYVMNFDVFYDRFINDLCNWLNVHYCYNA